MSAGLGTWPSMILSLVQLVSSLSLQMHSDGQTPSQSSPFLFSSRQQQTKVQTENTNVELIDLSAVAAGGKGRLCRGAAHIPCSS